MGHGTTKGSKRKPPCLCLLVLHPLAFYTKKCRLVLHIMLGRGEEGLYVTPKGGQVLESVWVGNECWCSSTLNKSLRLHLMNRFSSWGQGSWFFTSNRYKHAARETGLLTFHWKAVNGVWSFLYVLWLNLFLTLTLEVVFRPSCRREVVAFIYQQMDWKLTTTFTHLLREC